MMLAKITPFHVQTLILSSLVIILSLTGCGGGDSDNTPISITINERTDLQPEGREHVGMLPLLNDCRRYLCTALFESVIMELQDCKDCEGATWAIRNTQGNVQLKSKGKRLRYTTEAPGTWAVEVLADGQKLTYLFIVEDSGITVGAIDDDTPLGVETPNSSKPSKPILPAGSRPTTTTELTGASVPKNTALAPIPTSGLTLKLNGSYATISGLNAGAYTIAYDVDGKSHNQDITIIKGSARWPLKLENSRRQTVTINHITRKADGQNAEVLIQESFGEDKSMAMTKETQSEVVVSPTPISSQSANAPAKYVGKETKAGATLQGAWTDCKAKWVSETEIKMEAKAMFKMIYGHIYLDQAGEVHITLKRQDGSSRSIIRKLSQGQNQVTLLNLDPEFEAGETATLSLESKGCRMADVSSCNTTPGKDNLLRLTYVKDVITLVDLKIRY